MYVITRVLYVFSSIMWGEGELEFKFSMMSCEIWNKGAISDHIFVNHPYILNRVTCIFFMCIDYEAAAVRTWKKTCEGLEKTQGKLQEFFPNDSAPVLNLYKAIHLKRRRSFHSNQYLLLSFIESWDYKAKAANLWWFHSPRGDHIRWCSKQIQYFTFSWIIFSRRRKFKFPFSSQERSL